MSVRVRLAPSPTGSIHIGNLRTGLYNELFAKKHGGTLLLRIEDTDRSRFVEGATESYCRSLQQMGIIPDEGVWIDAEGKIIEIGSNGPYIQSHRQAIHQAYAEQLLQAGKAYRCFCDTERLDQMRTAQQAAGQQTRYDRTCRSLSPAESEQRKNNGQPFVVRLAVPLDGSISFHDTIRGQVTFQWKEIDDQVILKSDGMATYHLAAMCDDHDMGITHVIRAEEWLSSTPKHLFIYECFGWTKPQFAHLPLLLNPDRSKLSKRQGDVSVESYLRKGYLPEALLNFIALQGWNPSGEREVYTHDELCTLFQLEKVNKSGAIVNFEKLDWLNSQYIQRLSRDAFVSYIHEELIASTSDEQIQTRIIDLLRERIQTKEDVRKVVTDYSLSQSQPDTDLLKWKTLTLDETLDRLRAAIDALQSLSDESWNSPETIERALKTFIETNGWGNGEVLWPLRVALSGKKQSPPPFELLFLHGKIPSIEHLRAIIAAIEK